MLRALRISICLWTSVFAQIFHLKTPTFSFWAKLALFICLLSRGTIFSHKVFWSCEKETSVFQRMQRTRTLMYEAQNITFFLAMWNFHEVFMKRHFPLFSIIFHFEVPLLQHRSENPILINEPFIEPQVIRISKGIWNVIVSRELDLILNHFFLSFPQREIFIINFTPSCLLCAKSPLCFSPLGGILFFCSNCIFSSASPLFLKLYHAQNMLIAMRCKSISLHLSPQKISQT